MLRLLAIVALSAALSVYSPSFAADQCGPCPKTGDCPRQMSDFLPNAADQKKECPCPKTGDCPRNSLIFESIDDIRAASALSLVDLTNSAAGKWARNNIPPAILDFGKSDGDIVAIPVGTSQTNIMWVSNSALSAIGKNGPPTTQADLIADMDAARAKGIIPIAVGDQDWQQFGLFETILAAQSPKTFEDAVLKRDRTAVSSQDFLAALKLFKTLVLAADSGSANRGWTDTAMLVASGKALFGVSGSWAAGLFQDSQKRTGGAVFCAAFPGAPSAIVAAPTMFGLSDGDPANQNFDYVADSGFRTSFDEANGLLPVTVDGQAGPLDGCRPAQGSLATLAAAADAGGLVPESLRAPSDDDRAFRRSMIDQIFEYANDSSMTAEDAQSKLESLAQ